MAISGRGPVGVHGLGYWNLSCLAGPCKAVSFGICYGFRGLCCSCKLPMRYLGLGIRAVQMTYFLGRSQKWQASPQDPAKYPTTGEWRQVPCGTSTGTSCVVSKLLLLLLFPQRGHAKATMQGRGSSFSWSKAFASSQGSGSFHKQGVQSVYPYIV